MATARHMNGFSKSNNNNNNSNKTSLPLQSNEFSKKKKSSIAVALYRWRMKFVLLPPSIQFVIAIIGLVGLSTVVVNISRNESIHSILADADVAAEMKKNVVPLSKRTFDPATKEKLENRPHIPTPMKRIVHLIDADVTKVEVPKGHVSIPSHGKRGIIEKYNPLPHDVPALKGASELKKGDCEAVADWQLGHNPTCNTIHEMTWGWDHIYSDLDDLDLVDEDDTYVQAALLAGGAFRHVWMIREFDGTKRALKTLRAAKGKEFDLRNFDRHRRDAVAMERLTSSPLVVDIYGYCTNSALFDWGEGGDLESIFKREPDISDKKLLEIAYNVSLSIAHAHNFEDGKPTMAHTDIKPDQFLYQDGYYRLTDFNRVRFLMWNKIKDKQCGFTVGRNGGIWRAPEEYNYEIETEKVDVYSLGNVLFFLLTRGEYPWEDVATKEVYELVKAKKRPKIPKRILENESTYHKYMMQAIEMAYTHRMLQRPSALEVANKLKEGLAEL